MAHLYAIHLICVQLKCSDMAIIVSLSVHPSTNLGDIGVIHAQTGLMTQPQFQTGHGLSNLSLIWLQKNKVLLDYI